MEELVVTDPIVKPEEVISSYKVRKLTLDYKGPGVEIGVTGVVAIELEDNLGGFFRYQYEGPDAVDMMKWMNTANFSTTSMNKRILQKLSQDGVLPGTVTGEPEPPTGAT